MTASLPNQAFSDKIVRRDTVQSHETNHFNVPGPSADKGGSPSTLLHNSKPVTEAPGTAAAKSPSNRLSDPDTLTTEIQMSDKQFDGRLK